MCALSLYAPGTFITYILRVILNIFVGFFVCRFVGSKVVLSKNETEIVLNKNGNMNAVDVFRPRHCQHITIVIHMYICTTHQYTLYRHMWQYREEREKK